MQLNDFLILQNMFCKLYGSAGNILDKKNSVDYILLYDKNLSFFKTSFRVKHFRRTFILSIWSIVGRKTRETKCFNALFATFLNIVKTFLNFHSFTEWGGGTLRGSL